MQARWMVLFQREVRRNRRRRDGRGRLLPFSPGERSIRDGFYRLLKRLNRTGPTNISRREGGFRSRAWRHISPKYLAGFIDGEGSLMLAKVRRVVRRDSAYVARISVDNTNKAVLQDLQHSFGGSLYEQRPQKAGWSRGYKLLWTGKNVEGPLRLVAPYLRVKRDRAVTFFRFIDHQRRTGSGRAPSLARIVAYREALFLRMKQLNAKGATQARRESRTLQRTKYHVPRVDAPKTYL